MSGRHAIIATALGQAIVRYAFGGIHVDVPVTVNGPTLGEVGLFTDSFEGDLVGG